MGGGLPFDGKTADRDPLQEKGRELEVLLPASCEMFEKPQAEADMIGRADLEELRRRIALVLVTPRGLRRGRPVQLARRVHEGGAVGIHVQQEEVRVRRRHRGRLADMGGQRRDFSSGGQSREVRLAKPEAGQEIERSSGLVRHAGPFEEARRYASTSGRNGRNIQCGRRQPPFGGRVKASQRLKTS